MTESTDRPAAGVVASLIDALQEERQQYATLLAHVRQQGQLMVSHDLDGLQDSAHLLVDVIAQADMARLRREHLAEELMRTTGGPQDVSLSAWLQGQPPALRRVLDGPVQTVRRAAGELERANEMNRRLANFCLDLVEEEAAVLRRCLLEDPAGRYDQDAQPAKRTQGGVMQHKA